MFPAPRCLASLPDLTITPLLESKYSIRQLILERVHTYVAEPSMTAIRVFSCYCQGCIALYVSFTLLLFARHFNPFRPLPQRARPPVGFLRCCQDAGPRVNFEFEACKLKYRGFTVPLPPVGKVRRSQLTRFVAEEPRRCESTTIKQQKSSPQKLTNPGGSMIDFDYDSCYIERSTHKLLTDI